MKPLHVKDAQACRWDMVSLGEVMLRLDPGDLRIHTARTFRVWEGGGEYNVARGLRRCFALRTAIVTALVDNPVGRLVEDLMLQGGVDQSHVQWRKDDGAGRSTRNGLNFTERGFGVRGPLGCSDRGHTAVSQLAPGDLDWERIFGTEGARWFHTGGIFAALSGSTAGVAREAMEAARRHGTVVSYDLNYRPSLWQSLGGEARAREVNRQLAPLVDVMVGNGDDFRAALGVEAEGVETTLAQVAASFSNLSAVATSVRRARSATTHDSSAFCYAGGTLYQARPHEALEVYDRVGGGDSFASGLIFGLLTGRGTQWAVECGAAHGALAMTTPGDTSMATLAEVEKLMAGGSARVVR